jgi:hypothetical protein
MQVLQEIMALLNNVEFKTTKLNTELPQTKETMATFRELERVAVRYLAIARRMGLPENATHAIQILSQMVVVIAMVQMSSNMLMRSTPYGWVMGMAGLILSGLSAYDTITGI